MIARASMAAWGALFALTGAVYGAVLADDAVTPDSPATRAIIDRTIKAAGPGYAPVARHLCYLHSPQDRADLARRRAGVTVRATKVFDDLYYVGTLEYGAWAYDTPDGIILFDSLDSPENAKLRIIDGLRTLGVDPQRIKTVIITHGHGDHFGGAAYLKSVTNATLYASDVDWATMRRSATDPRFPKVWAPLVPAKDAVIADGQTMGDPKHRILFRFTPGHTPGTVSAFFPVHEAGKTHMVALWGGVGIPTELAAVNQYRNSAGFFQRFGDRLQVDVGLTNHPHSDMSLENLALVQKRTPGAPNPFVVGRRGFDAWTNVLQGCAAAEASRLEEVK